MGEKKFWNECYEENGIPIAWKKGDLAIICNYRTAHGRPAYELDKDERRDLAVIWGRRTPAKESWRVNFELLLEQELIACNLSVCIPFFLPWSLQFDVQL